MATSDPKFKLLPFNLPADIDVVLCINHRVRMADEDARKRTGSKTEDEYVKESRPSMKKYEFDGEMAPRMRAAKIVIDEDGKEDADKAPVAFVLWRKPNLVKDTRSEEQKTADFEKKLADIPMTMNKKVAAKMMWEDDILSKKYLGEDYESRFWELRMLSTDPKYQRKGLGTQLVQWGLEQVEAQAKENPGSIDGAYLVASLAGVRTYEKSGFVQAGNRFDGEVPPEFIQHVWLSKRI